jgi:glyoxylase-like metal-dependent hydrolase (beta-lactamase superfamily II)
VTEVADGVFVLQDRNVFIYVIKDGDAALLVDAGFEETARMLMVELESIGVRRIARVLLTHGHGDHYEGCAELVRAHGAAIGIHPDDARLIVETGDVVLYRELDAAYPGLFPVPDKSSPAAAATFALAEGTVVTLRDRSLRVLHVPGHSEGSVCLLDEDHGLLFSGDAASGDFVHFYCRPGTVDASLERLERTGFSHLLMAHPYPPEHANVLPGDRARAFLARSRSAVASAAGKVAARVREDPDATPKALTEELGGPTLISVIKMMESARGTEGGPPGERTHAPGGHSRGRGLPG